MRIMGIFLIMGNAQDLYHQLYDLARVLGGSGVSVRLKVPEMGS